MSIHARFWVGILFWLLPCAALADPPVTIGATECFANMSPRGGVYPIVVALHNAGPSADGALIVKSGVFSSVLRTYVYPVSLPTGTDKQILVYPAVGDYAEKVDFSFDGSARAKDVSLPVLDREGMQIGMIGDEIGALSSLRLTAPTQAKSNGYPGGPQQAPRYNDCYAKPEAAPDRAAGYQSVSVLVISGGAERLRPEQWAAIRHWVLDGGSLILLGGAGATYLRVPDVAPLLPLADVQDASIPVLSLPQNVLAKSLPGGTVALATGTPRPGSQILATQGGHVVLARQALGAGAVLFVGFDPLEQPFRGWAGQHDLWLGLIHQAVATIPAWNLRQWTAQQNSFDEDNNGYYGGITPASGRVRATNHINPFRIKLPPITTIAWLFLAYFILVIPVTYIVLKRLGRLEWAWVTSPLLSVAFAYAFYLFTAQLYQAGLSRRTAGVLVANAGDPNAQFDGFSEMFFPHGGSYKVGIPGAEAMEMSPFSGGDDNGGMYYAGPSGGPQTEPLRTVDIGDVSAPDFQMGNLAFRRLYHTEPVSLGGPVTATLTQDAAGGLSGTLRNGTGETLIQCFVYEPEHNVSVAVGDLAPGESKTVGKGGSADAGAIQASPFVNTVIRHETSAGAGVFLVAHTSGEQFGPALGRDVGGNQSVALLVSLPVTGGKTP